MNNVSAVPGESCGEKCLDADQTCIAPDYLFCHEKVMNTIVHILQICMYGWMHVGMKMCICIYIENVFY